jgi:2-oxoglutarate dehydrogenase E2 component (dihydrolipoamide succinyltransferase)
MSLRDIYSNNEPGNISLHTEAQGNGSGLGNFHTVNPEDREPNNTPKIVGALAVALMVGAAGIGLYASSGSSTHAKPMVSASNAPMLPPPSAVPAAAPAPQQDAMTTPADANTPATPSTDVAPAPAPMKAADAAPAKETTKTADAAPVKSTKATKTAKADTSTDNMASTLNGDKSQTVVPKQTAAAEPVSPTPSPNDVASNSTQSSVAVQPNATSASDMPAAQAPQQQANTATPVAPEQAQPTVQAPAEATPAPAAPAPATEAAPAAQPSPAPAQ